jgi:uncharacterized protein (DUF924 family)
MTVKDLDQVVESKEDAVAAVVLLDQLPRNMFRGMEAAKVSRSSLIISMADRGQAYNVYDPIARDLAKLYLIDRNYTKRDQCML